MIEILEHAGSDNSIANTARVSMQFDANWNDLPEDYTEVQRDKLISYLAKHKHTSPFRHTSITLRMDVPIFLARQLGKHQVGMSWNEVSRRYVDTDIEFFTPNNWRAKPDGSIKQGSAGALQVSNESLLSGNGETLEERYEDFMNLTLEVYEQFLEDGVAPEMARMILPQSMMTQVIWTGSLMAFAHVYKLRIDSHAQIEAQDFAKALDKAIRPLFPVSWVELTE